MPTEKSLQQWTKKLCKKHNILCYKIESPGTPGVTDLLLIRIGRVFFMELKSPMGTGRLSPIQQFRIQEMRAAGATVYVCASKEEVIAALRHQGADIP